MNQLQRGWNFFFLPPNRVSCCCSIIYSRKPNAFYNKKCRPEATIKEDTNFHAKSGENLVSNKAPGQNQAVIAFKCLLKKTFLNVHTLVKK